MSTLVDFPKGQFPLSLRHQGCFTSYDAAQRYHGAFSVQEKHLTFRLDERNDVSLIRTRSPVITTFPWLSAAVGTRPDIRTFASSQHCLSGFLNHLRNFERTCLLSPKSIAGKYFRHLLQLEFSLDELPTLNVKPGRKTSPQDWAVLASVVCAYRLADVVALLETEPNVLSKPVPRTLKQGPSTPLQWLYRLDNWTNLLTKFKRIYATEKNPRQQGSHFANAHVGLIKSVVQCSTAGDLNNISANIFVAALHLEYLMKHPFAEDQLPELTESFQELTEIRLEADDALSAPHTSTSLNEQELSFWTDTFGNGNTSAGKRPPSSGRERQPLQLALAISPLYLLIPNQIMSKQLGRENIISTSMALGNQRPAALIAVEKSIWSVLFRLAEGTISPGDAVQAIQDGIDWSNLERCSTEESLWFKLPKNESSRPKNGKGPAVPESIASSSQTAAALERSFSSTSLSSMPEDTMAADALDPDLPLEGPIQSQRQPPLRDVHHPASQRAQSSQLASSTDFTLYVTPRQHAAMMELNRRGVPFSLVRQNSPPPDIWPPLPTPQAPTSPTASTSLIGHNPTSQATHNQQPSLPSLNRGEDDNLWNELDLQITSTSSPDATTPRRMVETLSNGGEERDRSVSTPGFASNELSTGTEEEATNGLMGDDQDMSDGPQSMQERDDSQSEVRAGRNNGDRMDGDASALRKEDEAKDIDDDDKHKHKVEVEEEDENGDEEEDVDDVAKHLQEEEALEPAGSETDDGDEDTTGDAGDVVVSTAREAQAVAIRRSVRLLPPTPKAASALVPRTRSQAAAATEADRVAASSTPAGTKGFSSTPKRQPRRKPPPKADVAGSVERTAGEKRKRSPTDYDEVPPKNKKLLSIRPTSLALEGSGTKENPIDVDGYSLFVARRAQLYEVQIPTLSPLLKTQTKRYTLSQPLRVWDAKNLEHEIRPRLHSPEELAKLGLIMQSVGKSHVNNQARHVSAPASSIFYRLDYKSYKQLTHSQAEAILQRQCIVVCDMEWEDMDFDEEGLSTLGALDAVVSIQDLSLPHPADDLSERLVHGTTQQILQSSRADAAGKALNGLSFPFDTAELEKTTYAACRVAWKSTSRTVFQSTARMPVSDIHWGLAATEGAMTFWHIDSDGLATTVDVRTGEKLWIAATGCQEKFSTLGLLLSNSFEIDRPPLDFDIEAILLTKNTRLIMRPNVIHSAYTSKHTICHGSHFYSTGTMESTLVSLIHGFICHGYITNISHPETRILLRRMVHFYHRGLVEGAYMTGSEKAHLPQIDVSINSYASFDHVFNFLAACALVFFSNALDPRTYIPPGMDSEEGFVASEGQKTIMDAYDANAITLEEREEICEARGATLEALAWFRASFSVRYSKEEAPLDLVARYFTSLARSILRYKHVAEFNQVKSAANFTTKDLEAQIENLLKMDGRSWALWKASHQGKWRDPELKKASAMKVDSCGFRLKFNGLGMGEKEEGDLAELDCEEGEFERDRKIRLEDIECFIPEPSVDTAWRKELICLDEADRYLVRRDAIAESSSRRVNRKGWKAAGASEFDRRYFDAMEWRQRQEVNMVKARLNESRKR